MPAAIDNAVYDRDGNQWRNKDHYLNLLDTTVQPVRFAYLQDIITQRLAASNSSEQEVLDIGCGGGFMSEALAHLGFRVTGLDPAEVTLQHARQHSIQQELAINYQSGHAEKLPFFDDTFDLVCACDVLEHVSDLPEAIKEASRVLKPGGLFFYDTINRTLKSRLAVIDIAQNFPLTAFMAKNVHVWHKLIKPKEIFALMAKHQLEAAKPIGIAPIGNPLRLLVSLIKHKFSKGNNNSLSQLIKLTVTPDISIHYMGYAIKQGARHE